MNAALPPLRTAFRSADAVVKAFVINEGCRIPLWVTDFEAFRRWTLSPDFPTAGRIDYLKGEIWVDPAMEELYCHNQVKTHFTVVLGGLTETEDLGLFMQDRMRLIHPQAGLSCEPDGMFASWETLQTGRLREVVSQGQGVMELEGTPDMTLEILSNSSVQKDTRELKKLYGEAGISEYWLVDARRQPLQFTIYRHTSEGYRVTPAVRGWLKSEVFGKKFRLTQTVNRLGKPKFTLEMRP
jgi:Uma2 family endonuclease